MRHKVFSVFDAAAGAYLPPFFAPTVGYAVRMFQTAASTPGQNFHDHAPDYTLFEIGTFDDEDGRLEALAVFAPLGTALEHKAQFDGRYSPAPSFGEAASRVAKSVREAK